MTTALDHLIQEHPDYSRTPTWAKIEPTLPREEAIRQHEYKKRTILKIARKNGDMRPIEHLMADLKDTPTTLEERESRS